MFIVYGKIKCAYCDKAVSLLRSNGYDFQYHSQPKKEPPPSPRVPSFVDFFFAAGAQISHRFPRKNDLHQVPGERFLNQYQRFVLKYFVASAHPQTQQHPLCYLAFGFPKSSTCVSVMCICNLYP